ncbi:MAG TPA: NAD-dependent epimerase/dehydratase family protein [Candidatus Limnocylindria bacterium]|nr:NAD-dependent epimerase/dehydratase family protein [Candidatus Limnocylindria bacterium]
MKLIVTGGSGFLGSHVADHLKERGHAVTVFDAAPTERHRSIVGDLLDPEALRSAFGGIEAVCHLGAIGDVYLAGEKPALAASVNAVGTANVCDAALASGLRRVVVASTWEVYGEPHYQPLDEKHPLEPDHPYNITKLAGERLALAYARLKQLDVVALRLGTAFGTRMRPNSVFSIFIRKAMAKEAITIQGSGEQGRQFTHASDIARAFEAAITKGTSGRAYNIVAPEMITIKRLAQTVAKRLPTEVTFGAARPGDVPSATVSSELAAAELGWSAVKPFDEALDQLIEHHRATAKVPPAQ